MPATMLVYFVRHGQTDHNVQGIIQGHLDTPLNEWGRQEARLLADRLESVPFSEAYTSPLSRASETAFIVADRHPGLRLWPQQLLKERYLGSMEGRRRKKKEKAPRDAESCNDLCRRCLDWLDELFENHKPFDPSTPVEERPQASMYRPQGVDEDSPRVLVVTHGAWLGMFLNCLLKFKAPVAEKVNLDAPCVNTSIMKVWFWREGGKWGAEIRSWGDDSHLRQTHDARLGAADDLTRG